MANEAIARTVDDLIAKGRIQRELRDEYIRDMEAGLQSDLLRGADYTNKTKQLADEKRANDQRLQAEYQKLQQDRARLEQWQHQVQGELSKLDALPEMAAKLAAYEQALKDYQIYDQVHVPQIPKPTAPSYAPQPQQGQFQQQQQQGNRFMTMETAAGALRDFALLQSKVNRIQNQHMQLFGKVLEDDLVSHFLDTGEDPEQHWRIKYAVDARRQQIFESDRLAEMAKIKEEMRAELMKEFAMDPSRVTGSPFGKPQGALTPLLENYAQSRALANAAPHAHDKAPAPGATEFVPPEKRSELAMSRDRVAKATEMFNQHFDINGNPTTDQGRKFSQVYKSD